MSYWTVWLTASRSSCRAIRLRLRPGSVVACAPGAAVGALALAAATVSGTVAFVIGLVGGVPAAAWAGYYGFIKDGLGRGQSIGKKKMRLMVVHLQSNAPCSKSQSALRALVMTGLHLIPYLGWLVEPVLVMAAAGGRRLGDQAAGTQVIAADLYRRAK